MRVFPKIFNCGQKTNAEGEQLHLTDSGSELNKEKKANRVPAPIYLCSLTGDTTTSRSHHHVFPAMIDSSEL